MYPTAHIPNTNRIPASLNTAKISGSDFVSSELFPNIGIKAGNLSYINAVNFEIGRLVEQSKTAKNDLLPRLNSGLNSFGQVIRHSTETNFTVLIYPTRDRDYHHEVEADVETRSYRENYLYDSKPGLGTASEIRFDPGQVDGADLEQNPASFIRLGHEFCHALDNLLGLAEKMLPKEVSHHQRQALSDFNHAITQLNELKTVGLIPGAGVKVSENIIREEAHYPYRTKYGNLTLDKAMADFSRAVDHAFEAKLITPEFRAHCEKYLEKYDPDYDE